jgi:flagellar biosynthesis protein FlhB
MEMKDKLEQWKKELKEMTLSQAIRITLFIILLIGTLNYMLRYVFIKLSAEMMIDIYNFNTIFENNTNISQETITIFNQAYADAYFYTVFFYIFVTTMSLIATYKWFVKPEKLTKGWKTT